MRPVAGSPLSGGPGPIWQAGIFPADFRVRAFVFDPRRLIDHDN